VLLSEPTPFTSFETVLMDESLKTLGDHLRAKLGGAIISWDIAYGELNVVAQAGAIASVLTFLRDDPDCRFSSLMDVTAVDYPTRVRRFDVVDHLLSMHRNHRIRVKVEADEDTQVPSVAGIFSTANWFERETFDMYGILALQKKIRRTGTIDR
jgi:NADH-quinone oxidoreductase subunit C